MINYTDVDNFPVNVRNYDVTDPVIGGPTGTANKPLQDLADRTFYLKKRLNRIEDEIVLTSNASIDATLFGHLITVYSSGLVDIQLADVATFPHGAVIPFSSFCNPGCVVNLKTTPGQTVFDTDGGLSVIHMHHKESLCLIALTTHWCVQYMNGNFTCAGEEVKGRKEIINTISLKGQLLQRNRYPRLWKWVQTNLTMWQELCDEALWFLDATTYRGLFTTGDGLTTFRIPDERGMFERMLDAGRGIDFDRAHNFAGGYEVDELKQHDHDIPGEGGGSLNLQSVVTNANSDEGYNQKTAKTGGSETRPKNTGKLNLIKF